jgi:hypothetical protein
VALVGVIGAEVVAGSLTVRKAALDPGSETMSTWIVDGLAGCVAILACDPARPTELLYPMNHVVLNTAVVVAMMAGRRRPTVAGAR